MKRIKILSALMALVIFILSIGFTNVSAANDNWKAPENSINGWYLRGDADLSSFGTNEKLSVFDARKVLKMAAYLEAKPTANTIAHYAADIDGDGIISILDARKILRVALTLDAAPAQIPCPYNNSKVVVQHMIDVANQLKTYNSPNHCRIYTATDTTNTTKSEFTLWDWEWDAKKVKYVYKNKTNASKYKEIMDSMGEPNLGIDEDTYTYNNKYPTHYYASFPVEAKSYVIDSAVANDTNALASGSFKKVGDEHILKVVLKTQTFNLNQGGTIYFGYFKNLTQVNKEFKDMVDEITKGDMGQYVTVVPKMTYTNPSVEYRYKYNGDGKLIITKATYSLGLKIDMVVDFDADGIEGIVIGAVLPDRMKYVAEMTSTDVIVFNTQDATLPTLG